MMNRQPLVSILIPCYNAEKWIGQAIESALQQTYDPVEVIVIDDGSTDGSLDVIRRFGAQILWETGPNRGGGYTRNRLLKLSKGEWIQYLDADDYLLPEKVENQARSIRDGMDVIYGPILMRYEDEGGRTELLSIAEPHDAWRLLALWKLPQTGCSLWRRQALVDVGSWRVEQRVCQEHELYLRLLMAGKEFVYQAHSDAVYRQWSTDTVCRKDEPTTYRHRVEIMRRAEDFLIEQGKMTAERRLAFDEAYLACSRIIWNFDPEWARSIMQHVQEQNSGKYQPAVGQVPRSYVALYRLFGFDFAERAAAWKRQLVTR